MLGHLMEWFYAGLAGIKQTDHSIAYKEVEIKPEFAGDVKYAKATFQSPYGFIKSEWTWSENEVNVVVEIPANCTAVVYLTAIDSPVFKVNGVQMKGKFVNGKLMFRIGSGSMSLNTVNNF